MRLREDFSMGLRGLFSRPLETILLILGIALGIGATAAGLSLFVRTVEVGDELLTLPEYREIIVRPGIDTSEAEGPAALVTEEETTLFTSEDLKAADEIEAVDYAYFVRNTGFRLGNSGSWFGRGGDQGTNSGPPDAGGQNSGSAENGTSGTTAPDNGSGPPQGFDPSRIMENLPEDMPNEMRDEIRRQMEPLPEIDDPEPVLEEINGRMVSPEYFTAMGLAVAQGDVFTEQEAEDASNIIVLGSELAKTLFEDGESYGRRLIMNRRIYTITGVLKPTGTDLDKYGFTPFYLNQFAARFIPAEIHFMVGSSDDLDDAEFQIYRWFSMKHGNVTVTTPREQAELANSRNSRLAAIILFLAGAGFLIASVNVSNILLSRTIRQFRNIGILKALGASAADLFRLYFIESLFLSVCGMLAGGVITLLLSALLSSNLGAGIMSPLGGLIGVLGAVVITIALTIYPSFQASKVPAAQAIKTE